jgi:hypothetical protein
VKALGRSALCLSLAGRVRLDRPSVLARYQRRQLGDVGRDAPRFIIGQGFGLHRLGFVRPAVDVGKRLIVGVAHDLAAGHPFSGQGGGKRRGKRYLWSEIVALRRAQIAAARRAEQLALFNDLIEDARPPSQRTATGRYSEPLLFDG